MTRVMISCPFPPSFIYILCSFYSQVKHHHYPNPIWLRSGEFHDSEYSLDVFLLSQTSSSPPYHVIQTGGQSKEQWRAGIMKDDESKWERSKREDWTVRWAGHQMQFNTESRKERKWRWNISIRIMTIDMIIIDFWGSLSLPLSTLRLLSSSSFLESSYFFFLSRSLALWWTHAASFFFATRIQE